MPTIADTLVFYEPADLAESAGIAFEPYAPAKRPEPVVTGDLPDEANQIGLYGTIIRDPWTGRFRMWYTGHRPTNYARYAESDDGIVWTKPAIRDARWIETDSPNAVMPGQFPVVLCNPDAAEPIDRWWMFIWQGRMDVFRSADGTRWERHPARWNPVWPLEAGEGLGEVPVPFWDPDRREYIAMTRIWSGPHPFARETAWDPDRAEYIRTSGMRVRMVGRGTSPDGIFWSGPDVVWNCDDLDPLGSQPYELAAWPYAGRHLGLVGILHSGRNPAATLANTLRLYLCWSVDGCYTWSRLSDRLRELVPLGPEGAWDAGMITQPTRLVEVGDEWWCYYGGHSNRHVFSDDARSGIGLATMPRGRLIGMHATGDAAEIATHPVRPAEGTFTLNADARDGAIRVTIDGAGEIPRGWSDPVRGDGVRLPVTWNGTSWRTASPSRTTLLRLRFRLEGNARLWECAWS